jgi:uncharacterized protein YceK
MKKSIAYLLIAIMAGCAFIQCPINAIEGKPFKRTFDDLKVIAGEKYIIMGGDNFYKEIQVPRIEGIIDLPFALTLDALFFPVGLAVWIYKAIDSAIDNYCEY